MTTRAGQSNKRLRIRPKRLAMTVIVLVLVLTALLLARQKVGTVMLTEQITYRKSLSGNGAFYFYEYAPEFLQGETLNISEKFLNRRLRAETGVLPLKEEAIRRYRERLAEDQTALSDSRLSVGAKSDLEAEIAYLNQMITAKQLMVPRAGLIKLKLDGYESLCRPQGLNALLPGDISADRIDMAAMPGFKIVDNRRFFLAVDLPQTLHARELEYGGRYTVRIDDGLELNAAVERIVSDELNRTLVILSVDSGYEKIQDRRYVKAEIELDEHSAFKVPMSAVFNASGDYYCYIADASGIVCRRKLALLDAIEEEQVFIAAAELPDDENGRPQQTVERWDRIILNPNAVKEGAIY